MRHDLRIRTLPRMFWLAVALALVAIAATAPASAQERGRCASTEIPGHLILPDGSVSEAAAILSVCFEGEVVPGRGRYVIRIDGRSWGQLLGRIGRSEDVDGRGVPLLVFTPRTGNDHVRLLGMAWPDGNAMATHVLHGPGLEPTPGLADASRLLTDAAEGDLIVVASGAPSRRVR